MSELFPGAQPLLEATTQVSILRDSILVKTLGQPFMDKFKEQEEIREATASAMPVDEQAMSWLIKSGKIRDLARGLGASDATIDRVSEGVYGNMFAAILGMNQLGDLSEEESQIAKVENNIDDIVVGSFGVYSLGSDSAEVVPLSMVENSPITAGRICLQWEVAENTALEFEVLSTGDSLKLGMFTVAKSNKIHGFYWDKDRKPMDLMEAPHLALDVVTAVPDFVSRINNSVVPALYNKLGSIK